MVGSALAPGVFFVVLIGALLWPLEQPAQRVRVVAIEPLRGRGGQLRLLPFMLVVLPALAWVIANSGVLAGHIEVPISQALTGVAVHG